MINFQPNHDQNKKGNPMTNSIQKLSSLAVVFIALGLSGCGASPLAILDKVGDGVGTVREATYTASAASIDRYCGRVAKIIRDNLRENINSRTVNGDIVITCLNDHEKKVRSWPSLNT